MINSSLVCRTFPFGMVIAQVLVCKSCFFWNGQSNYCIKNIPFRMISSSTCMQNRYLCNGTHRFCTHRTIPFVMTSSILSCCKKKCRTVPFVRPAQVLLTESSLSELPVQVIPFGITSSSLVYRTILSVWSDRVMAGHAEPFLLE